MLLLRLDVSSWVIFLYLGSEYITTGPALATVVTPLGPLIPAGIPFITEFGG